MEGAAMRNRSTSREIASTTGKPAYGRREFLARSGLVLGAAGLGGSLLPRHVTASGAAPASGGELTVGLVSAVGRFDPHGWSGFTSNVVTNHVYQGLVRLNFDTSEIEPCLAESWERVDPQTYRYTLRDGVTFHNGAPLTVDDVIFSTERSKEVSWGVYALANFESISALDDRTVEVKLTAPDWRFDWFYYWPPGAILSQAYFDEVGEEEATATPVGTNAFRFVSSSSSNVELARFDDYWEDGLPYLDALHLDVLDGTTVVAGLQTGEIALSPQVAYDQIEPLQSAGAQVRSRVGPHIMTTYFDLSKEPFGDKNVRKAIAEAVDNAGALSAFPVEYIEPSAGALIHSSFPDSFFDETNAVYTSDLDKAREYLAASSVPDGFSATWTVAADRPQELAIVLGAQERLAEIGIDIEIQRLPDPDVAAMTFTNPREFEIITYNWLHNMPNTLDPLAALVTSKGPNFPGYENPDVEQLVDEIIVSTDEAERSEKLHQVLLTVLDDVPLLGHGWDGIIRVESSDITTPEQTIIGEWDDWFRVTSLA
jgi:peptide/nickel transport system substrate-binding protein